MLIYKTDKYPAFVDYYGQGEYIPTRIKEINKISLCDC